MIKALLAAGADVDKATHDGWTALTLAAKGGHTGVMALFEGRIVTSWSSARFGTEGPPWEIRKVEGKGYATFALRRFEKGDWIMSEKPTVWVRGHHPFDEDQIADIEAKVEALCKPDKQSFYEMANVFPKYPVPPLGYS